MEEALFGEISGCCRSKAFIWQFLSVVYCPVTAAVAVAVAVPCVLLLRCLWPKTTPVWFAMNFFPKMARILRAVNVIMATI